MRKRLISIPLLLAATSLTYYNFSTFSNYKCREAKPLTPVTPFNFKKLKSRQEHLDEIKSHPEYDIVVIGGGCNGTGVLLDAATRGFKTLLIEKEDFGSGATSKSTKLIHGGVRYLEQVFAFNLKDSIASRMEKLELVKEAISERSYMIKNAGHLSEKIPFVVPCTGIFDTAYYYTGLIVYYMIYRFYAPKEFNSIRFNFPTFMGKEEMRKFFPYIGDEYTKGVVYEDGSFNDARVNLSAILTATEGNGIEQEKVNGMPESFVKANVLNKAEFVNFIKSSDGVIQGVNFRDSLTNTEYTVKCKHVVNCAGAWGDKIRQIDNPEAPSRIIHVAGSHITYDEKIGSSKYGLALPSKDGRVTIVHPWQGRIIAGTTERIFEDPTLNPTCSEDERMFIHEAISDVMKKLEPKKLFEYEKTRWTGLRPLVSLSGVENTKDISRSHIIEKEEKSGLISLMGGKWTIFRKMGADVIDIIAKLENEKILEKNKASTNQNNQALYPAESLTKHLSLIGSCSELLREDYENSFGLLAYHLFNNYGSRSESIFLGDLTQLIGPMTISELKYIIENEMPTCPEDVLIRRARSAFLLEREKLFKLIPVVCKLMYEAKLINLEKEQTLEKYIEETTERFAKLDFN